MGRRRGRASRPTNDREVLFMAKKIQIRNLVKEQKMNLEEIAVELDLELRFVRKYAKADRICPNIRRRTCPGTTMSLAQKAQAYRHATGD